MGSEVSLDLVPTIQQAITNLLLTYEPEFLRFGYRLFVSFAVISDRLAWHQNDVRRRAARRADV